MFTLFLAILTVHVSVPVYVYSCVFAQGTHQAKGLLLLQCSIKLNVQPSKPSHCEQWKYCTLVCHKPNEFLRLLPSSFPFSLSLFGSFASLPPFPISFVFSFSSSYIEIKSIKLACLVAKWGQYCILALWLGSSARSEPGERERERRFRAKEKVVLENEREKAFRLGMNDKKKKMRRC